MVKVREFFCGCSLRSGTFFSAWTTLICNFILFLLALYQFLYLHRELNYFRKHYPDLQNYYDEHLPSPYIFVYNLIRTIAGISTSLIAIWALHKNKVKFLNGLFWYLCYVVASLILSEILLIFQPKWEAKLLELIPVLWYFQYLYDEFEFIVLLLMVYLFSAAMTTYLALVVKSYRDYSLRNNAQNVRFEGSDRINVGFIEA